MAEHPIQGLMNVTMEKIHQMVDSNTIIGKPIITEDGTTILPVSKVSFGFASGGTDFDGKNAANKDLFGGGSGAGVNIQPVAFLVVKDGCVRTIQLSDNADTISRALTMLPELVGFLMFGNLLRECGVLNALSETAQNVLANLITLMLGLTVAGQMTADKFVRPDTLLILALGLVAFVFDTAGGVLFAKLLNLFLPEGKKLNPMIGAAGISAFPMSGRVVNKMGLEEDSQNFLLMYSISVNVSGQIASVIAGGLILTLMA